MRKITSKYKEEKKNKKKQLIVGLALVGLMIFSVVGYSFNRTIADGSEKINYNGFDFVKENGFWKTEINGLLLVFAYNPFETEELSGYFNGINNYYGKPLYVYSENSETESEIYKNLDQVILRRQYACLEGDEACKDKELPVKTCEDNFIVIKNSQEFSVRQEKNCIFISGSDEKIIKETDAFLFEITGIS